MFLNDFTIHYHFRRMEDDINEQIAQLRQEIEEDETELERLTSGQRTKMVPTRFQRRKTENLIQRLIRDYEIDPHAFDVSFGDIN
jgi:sugar-specific transcriptional regulator TrmB